MSGSAVGRTHIRVMQVSNRIIGLMAIFGGFAIIYGTLEFRDVPGQQFGSEFFPRITSVALVLTGICLAATKVTTPVVTIPDWFKDGRLFRAVSLPLCGLLWIFLAPELGFIFTTFLLVAVLILVLGGRLLSLVLVSSAITLVLYAVFGWLLRVPLPVGLIEYWFI